MKRLIPSLFVCFLAIFFFCSSALAAEESRTHRFELSVNGQSDIYAKPGDILTVHVTLCRTDAEQAAAMYGVQTELCYDAGTMEILDGSCLLAPGVETTELMLQGGRQALYLSYLSLDDGDLWEPRTIMGSFQIRILAQQGTILLENENCSVSRPDGSGSYPLTTQDLTVRLSKDCLVRFETMDGETAREITLPAGEFLSEPKPPVRRGYTFIGWYKDVHLTQPWDFETETVSSNRTLYAGWVKADDPVSSPVLLPIVAVGLALSAAAWMIHRRGRGK